MHWKGLDLKRSFPGSFVPWDLRSLSADLVEVTHKPRKSTCTSPSIGETLRPLKAAEKINNAYPEAILIECEDGYFKM